MLVGQDVKRAEGEDTNRLTLPVRPNRLDKLIDSGLEAPAGKDTEVGPERLKSWMVTFRDTL
jgi:hypothetical protein